MIPLDCRSGRVASGQAAVDALVRLLDLEALGDDRFRASARRSAPNASSAGRSPGRRWSPPVAPSTRSARCIRCTATSSGPATRPCRSRTAWKTSATGAPSRSGGPSRSSTARSIFFMSASFHVPEDGSGPPRGRTGGRAPAGGGADDGGAAREVSGAVRHLAMIPRPIDVRYVGEPGWVRPATGPRTRPSGSGCASTASCPTTRCCTPARSTFASDLTLLDSVLVRPRRGLGPGRLRRREPRPRAVVPPAVPRRRVVPLRLVSPSASGARGLATGRMFTLDGRHIARAVQEGLLRRVGG